MLPPPTDPRATAGWVGHADDAGYPPTDPLAKAGWVGYVADLELLSLIATFYLIVLLHHCNHTHTHTHTPLHRSPQQHLLLLHHCNHPLTHTLHFPYILLLKVPRGRCVCVAHTRRRVGPACCGSHGNGATRHCHQLVGLFRVLNT
jgi:hypothetical protein